MADWFIKINTLNDELLIAKLNAYNFDYFSDKWQKTKINEMKIVYRGIGEICFFLIFV